MGKYYEFGAVLKKNHAVNNKPKVAWKISLTAYETHTTGNHKMKLFTRLDWS